MRHLRPARTRRAAVLLAAAAVTLIATPAAAVAAGEYDTVITYAKPDQVVEYGQRWIFQATATNTEECCFGGGPAYGKLTGPGAISAVFYSSLNPATSTSNLTLQLASDVRPLEPGAYVATMGYPWFEPPVAATTSLTITPAALGIEARLISDPGAAGNSILTARFTGTFVDDFSPYEYIGSGIAPAGTWHLVIKDTTGATVLEEDAERAEGGNTLATSTYWTGAEGGGQYTASATFTPSGASASRFTVSPSDDFLYTASTLERPVPTSTATAPPPVALPDPETIPSSIPVPIWALAAGGLVVAGLAALLVVTLIRGRRPSAPALTPETEVEA